MYGEMNDVMMRTRAYENGVYVLFVHPEKVPGHRSRAGRSLPRVMARRDLVVHAQITLADFSEMSPIQYRRPELYGEITRRP